MSLKTKRYKLTDIATVERAKKGVLYPQGTVYIQVSATRGQVHQLHKEGTIETKYAVVKPKIDIYMPYFKVAFERCVPKFLARYQSTINIQISDFKFFEIDLHEDPKVQLEIGLVAEKCDEAMSVEKDMAEELKTLKKIALSKMMC